MYWAHLLPNSLPSWIPELMVVFSRMALKGSKHVVLGCFCAHLGVTGAWDFMFTMISIGLMQFITDPTMDLVFCSELEEDYLKVGDLCVIPMSWSDHYLVNLYSLGHNLTLDGGNLEWDLWNQMDS